MNRQIPKCDCSRQAPTYPTARAEPHLQGCIWRELSDVARSVLLALKEVLPPEDYQRAEARFIAGVSRRPHEDTPRVY